MGENKKVTIMVLKVDLQCEKCYRKVKKVLCKFPQIQDQKYDEKNNQVIIKVVCCSPEKIRDKLCCKGRCVIKSIDIIGPPPPEKEKEKKQEKEKEKPPPSPEKEKPPPSPEKEKPPPSPKKEKPSPVRCTCPPVTCTCPPVICKCPPVICTCPPVICTCPPVIWHRPPVKTCCTECYGGHPGGPCETGFGYRQYDGYCGRPVYVSYGGYCVIRPDCFSEENPQACAIM